MSQQTETFQVEGMTCGHCEMSVQAEVHAIPGVTEAHASAASGELTVAGDDFTVEQVAAAVAAAGYTLIH